MTGPSISFSPAQVDCICETLISAGEGVKLVEFFAWPGACDGMDRNSSTVIRARLYALYESRQFSQLFTAIKSNVYEPEFHDELQDLWFKAHYAENEFLHYFHVELRRRKPLGAVEKYRLRKKYPPPYTIWDGQETVYSFKENSRRMLRNCYKSNRYPTAEEKKSIADKASLSFVQVSNWFKNRRQRDKSSRNCSPIVEPTYGSLQD